MRAPGAAQRLDVFTLSSLGRGARFCKKPMERQQYDDRSASSSGETTGSERDSEIAKGELYSSLHGEIFLAGPLERGVPEGSG